MPTEREQVKKLHEKVAGYKKAIHAVEERLEYSRSDVKNLENIIARYTRSMAALEAEIESIHKACLGESYME